MFETKIVVRGNELDSYNHVNNAVYLNYLEQARWEIVKCTGILDYAKSKEILIVVTETHIRYKGMATVFDELNISTKVERLDPYLLFKHSIFNRTTNTKITVAEVKTILIDKNNKMVVDIPNEIVEMYQNYNG